MSHHTQPEAIAGTQGIKVIITTPRDALHPGLPLVHARRARLGTKTRDIVAKRHSKPSKFGTKHSMRADHGEMKFFEAQRNTS